MGLRENGTSIRFRSNVPWAGGWKVGEVSWHLGLVFHGLLVRPQKGMSALINLRDRNVRPGVTNIIMICVLRQAQKPQRECKSENAKWMMSLSNNL